MTTELPRLIYFPTRGRAELIRLTLAEAGVAYEEENFVGADGFAALKASGRLPFGAVPLWHEPDGFNLAQSAAIACHIARGHGLHGKSARANARCDETVGTYDDVRAEFRKIMLADPEKRPELRAALVTTVLPRWFTMLEQRLASNLAGGDYMVGDAVTIADLAVWYLLETASDNGFGATFAGKTHLEALFARIGSRPRIAEYVKSSRRWPVQLLPG